MTKVAFIICYNNTMYMKECMDYISWLDVPEGVETEIIGITDAESMAAGYNAAMNSSDAKYKVYLHQDVFILNKNFIQDIITVFKSDPAYGILGVIGSNQIVADGMYWEKWNIGQAYAWDSLGTVFVGLNDVNSPAGNAEAIDGLIMITQYDIPWREDIFDGFDFYDISQSKEFLLAGYKVGVVKQKHPWCFHDCGSSKLSAYDIYRKRFCETYKELGYKYTKDEKLENHNTKKKVIDNIIPQIIEALESENMNFLNSALDMAVDYYPFHTKLFQLYVIEEVIMKEKINKVEYGFYKSGMTADELIEKYTLYRFLLKRLEYGNSIETLKDVLDMIAASDNRLVAEEVIAKHTVYEVDKVIQKLRDNIAKITEYR